MKQRKKRHAPPPPPIAMENGRPVKPSEDETEKGFSESMTDSDDPVYTAAHKKAGELQRQVSEEGYVLLKNTGILPLAPGARLNVFGRHADLFFNPELCARYGTELNIELYNAYINYTVDDAGYTGSGFDEKKNEYARQNRTASGLFGDEAFLDPEPFIGYDVYNDDGSLRIAGLPEELLNRAKAFSDTAVAVIYRFGGEGADHEKGDETLSEGEAAMLSFCSLNFRNVIIILATNSVIDGNFLVDDTSYKFYKYTYGGGVYSNNIGREILADYESRTEILYTDSGGNPAPHVYPIRAERLGGVFYTCCSPGDMGAEALLRLMLGIVNPSGRLMDEIIYDYDDNPVSRSCGGMVFSRKSTSDDLYIYGHNYVAYKEGVYLGYKYFETFCPDKVVCPFGYGLSYTKFEWTLGTLQTCRNIYNELQFYTDVTVRNTGSSGGKDVVQLYVIPPYDSESTWHVEKPLVSLAAFAKTEILMPGEEETVRLKWNARDIACYSDTGQCYVLEYGDYIFSVAADAGAAHTAPAGTLQWSTDESLIFLYDEVTGTSYRNLFTGSHETGWRYDARGTEKENIVYIHRVDSNGVPAVAPGTAPENVIKDELTRETDQILDLESRGLSSCYEADGTDIHLHCDDIAPPDSNAVYRDKNGRRKNFTLQDLYGFTEDENSPDYHNKASLWTRTGLHFPYWSCDADDAVWNYFLNQFSANEMLNRFYHSGFHIPAMLEYGIPDLYSADTPGQIGTNNKMPMFRTTRYCDTILACTFNTALCEEFGFALAREVAASGENGTTYFYGPGSNLHRSCLSGKNSNYFSEDAYLSGWICGYFLKGLEAGGVNGCLKHFACNDQEISREGLFVFSNEQALRELYFAAFEHALKISGGQGIMTSLGRIGTVSACGNSHLTVELLRKEWGFDGMVITDGYGVTSYMYNINCMLGGNSGLLCFENSENLGECSDFMELYRYYLEYPGRTTAALRGFMKGSLHSVIRSHTFKDLYKNYDYYGSGEYGTSSDINWYEAVIAAGYEYFQSEKITYCGVKLQKDADTPPASANTNCRDRSGTILRDDYGLKKCTIRAIPGETVSMPVSVLKCAGIYEMSFSIIFDNDVFRFVGISLRDSVLNGYDYEAAVTDSGAKIHLIAGKHVFSKPCGRLFSIILKTEENAAPGTYPVSILPASYDDARFAPGIRDKQENEMSFALKSILRKSDNKSRQIGIYQSVSSGEWHNRSDYGENEDLADITLLPGEITVNA